MLLTFPAPAPAGSALPRGFVYLRDIDPTIVQDIRYAGSHNFVGRPIKGYLAAECILSASAAAALAKIQKMLAGKKLSLIVWDCYRPMRAVDDFLRWSRDPAVARGATAPLARGATAPLARGATAPHADMKAEFYPRNDKKNLFALGYLAPRSAHSRGSTVDLGLVPSGSAAAPPPDPSQPLKACTSPKGERFEDGTIDLGTGYDCLDALGRTSNALAGATALHHRQMLKSAMREAGFRPYFREWWHFQLNDEPFHRGFDFEVSASPATANSR
jgi:D-alanyl-D-alanine dipeptidase